MKHITVTDIIRKCGGRRAISDASRDTDHPITYQGVARWDEIGIAEVHWDLVMQLSQVSVEEIYAANKRLKKKSRGKAGVGSIVSRVA